MKVKTLIATFLMALPLVAPAQFDIGGGESGPPWKSFKLNPKTRIKLDFRNANPDMVISLLSKTSGVTIVKDPALKQPLTITSAKPVPLNDAFQIFKTVLDLAGYDLQKDNTVLVIRKRAEKSPAGAGMAAMMAMGAGADAGGGPGGGGAERTVLKVYPIQYANATEVARVLNEVFTTDAAQNANPFAQFGNRRGGMASIAFTSAMGAAGGGGGRGGRNTPSVKASADSYSNSVIVNAPSREQDQVESLISKLDKQTNQPQQTRVFKLVYAAAADIAPAVQNVLVSNAPAGRGGGAGANVPFEQRFQQAIRLGGSQAAFGTVASDVRTNSLIVTATDDNLKIVEQVIKELDQPVDVQNSVVVIPLQNARADLTAQVLNQAFSGRNGAGGQNNFGGGVNRTGNNNNNRNNRNNNNNNQRQGPAAPQDPNSLPLNLEDDQTTGGPLATTVDVTQGFQFFGGGGNRGQNQNTPQRDPSGRVVSTQNLQGQISVIADPTTNSLIVVGAPDSAELVRQIANQLDKIPQQVMIETLIVEASLDAKDKLGVEWSFAQQHAFGHDNATGSGTVNFGGNTGSATGAGFRYSIAGRDFSAFVNALKTDQKFHILSAPRIFTSNNQQAEINVSQQVPYVISQQTDTNGNVIFNYAFQDVGIVLTVTPRISANGTVTMDVNQTANDLQGFTSFNAPIVNQREANTTVSVRDGETIVLGGIMRTSVTSTVNKVPLIGDIPILGNLFRSTSKEKQKTELLVFLTPHIVRDSVDAAKVREETNAKLSPESQEAVKKALDKGNGGKQ